MTFRRRDFPEVLDNLLTEVVGGVAAEAQPFPPPGALPGAPLEHALEQPFEVRKHSHRAGNPTRADRIDPRGHLGVCVTNVRRIPVPRSPALLEHGPILLALARDRQPGTHVLRTGD